MSISRGRGADRIAWYVARRHVSEYHHAGVVRIGFFGMRPEGMFSRRRFARRRHCPKAILPSGALPVGAVPAPPSAPAERL